MIFYHKNKQPDPTKSCNMTLYYCISRFTSVAVESLPPPPRCDGAHKMEKARSTCGVCKVNHACITAQREQRRKACCAGLTLRSSDTPILRLLLIPVEFLLSLSLSRSGEGLGSGGWCWGREARIRGVFYLPRRNGRNERCAKCWCFILRNKQTHWEKKKEITRVHVSTQQQLNNNSTAAAAAHIQYMSVLYHKVSKGTDKYPPPTLRNATARRGSTYSK